MLKVGKKQKLTQKVLDKLLSEHNCTEIRIVKPDEIITTEYTETRLNIEVDKDNIIENVWVS